MNLRLFVIILSVFYPFFLHAQSKPESAETRAIRFVKATLALKNPAIIYDPAYQKIAYPMGDVAPDRGVCADVIIRAYRAIGVDLQQLVHEDMLGNFSLYPTRWGLKAPNTNIDHRRVPNLQVFFKRYGRKLAITQDPRDYKPGDIVTWNLRTIGTLPHIGIVTDVYTNHSPPRPMMMHNIGGGQVVEDILFTYTITGHYRYNLE